MAVTTQNPVDAAIRPFAVKFPQPDVDTVRDRFAVTCVVGEEPVTDSCQGVQLATMEALVRYWGTSHDSGWVEARLNAPPQFIAKIDGLEVHVIRVRSPHENAWPPLTVPGSLLPLTSGYVVSATAATPPRLGTGAPSLRTSWACGSQVAS